MNEPTAGVEITLESTLGPREVSEDRSVVSTIAGGKLLVVCDGHKGHRCADYCIDRFDEYFGAFYPQHSAIESLKHAMELLAKETDDEDSGTTLTAAFISPEYKKVSAAFVGDSPLMILTNDRFTMPIPHNGLYNLEERFRITGMGASWGTFKKKLVYRTTEGMHSFGVTRAFGSAPIKKVLSRKPEFLELELNTQLPWAVALGSDGICVKNNFGDEHERLERMLRSGMSAHDLVTIARQAMGNEPESGDNITAIVCHGSPVTAEHAVP